MALMRVRAACGRVVAGSLLAAHEQASLGEPLGQPDHAFSFFFCFNFDFSFLLGKFFELGDFTLFHWNIFSVGLYFPFGLFWVEIF